MRTTKELPLRVLRDMQNKIMERITVGASPEEIKRLEAVCKDPSLSNPYGWIDFDEDDEDDAEGKTCRNLHCVSPNTMTLREAIEEADILLEVSRAIYKAERAEVARLKEVAK